LTLLETAFALVLIAVLLSILLPALSSARVTSHKDQCQSNLRHMGEAWTSYLADHQDQYPFVPVQPAWQYGGVRFSTIDRAALPDVNRPLTTYLNLRKTRVYNEVSVCCPADRGIASDASAAGTGGRSAFESFGTSYRANAQLLDARLAGVSEEARGMRRKEITMGPSKLVVCGDAVWYEVAEATGRHADWHGEPDAGNLLFLDGSVRFQKITVPGAMAFDPASRHPAAAGAGASTRRAATAPATMPEAPAAPGAGAEKPSSRPD